MGVTLWCSVTRRPIRWMKWLTPALAVMLRAASQPRISELAVQHPNSTCVKLTVSLSALIRHASLHLRYGGAYLVAAKVHHPVREQWRCCQRGATADTIGKAGEELGHQPFDSREHLVACHVQWLIACW